MPAVTIKPGDKPIRDYQATLKRLRVQQGIQHEGGLRRAFGTLLKDTARRRNWVLVEELPVSGGRVRPDGTLRDVWQLPHGYWEAKDGRDDLEVEIRRKRERGDGCARPGLNYRVRREIAGARAILTQFQMHFRMSR